jgi:HPt (histidine-containing phosphotransfer) domain-containing protein
MSESIESMTSPPPAALDGAALEALTEMTGGDPEFLAELIDTFLEDGSRLLAEIQAAAANGDAATLRRAAHTLKSNGRTFGAAALGELCQELETRAAAGQLAEVEGLVGRVAAEYTAAAAALTAARNDAR